MAPRIKRVRLEADTRRYRWAVLSRIGAAALGGYTLTAACTVVLAKVLPLARVDA
jgi:hypothetical protein